MAIICWRRRARVWAGGLLLLLVWGVPARSDEQAARTAPPRPGVAARSDSSTAATGRPPLASRIVAGARAPVAPEPAGDEPDAARVAVAPAASSPPPQRSPAPRLAALAPVGEAAKLQTTIENAPPPKTAERPAQSDSQPPRTPKGGGAGSSKATGEPSRVSAPDPVPPPRESSSRQSRSQPPVNPSPPPVAKPSKNRWSLLRWFNPEWIRPAEPLPMVPTPWSHEKADPAGADGGGAGGPTADNAPVTRAPRTQVAMPRVSLDVRESAIEVAEGDPISFRITVANTGNRPAHDVDTTVYFAEGIEPEAVGGAEATISAGEVRFETIEEIVPGEKVELTVRGSTGPPGIVVYRAEVIARETPGTIAREGAVTILGTLFGPEEKPSVGDAQADSAD